MYIKTVRRNWLKKQIEKGLVEGKCDYHLTDDYAWDAAHNNGVTGWMPVRISHPVWEKDGTWNSRCIDRDFVEGQLNFREDYFTTKSGAAWEAEKDTITFLVHSNLSYTLRIKK